MVDHHAIGELTEVRLIDLEHVHYGLTGNADLLADDPLALLHAAAEQALLNGVSVLDAQLRKALGQRRDHPRLIEGVEQLIT
ncbi:hypothetical protein D3C85_1658070 [compost metagenome]